MNGYFQRAEAAHLTSIYLDQIATQRRDDALASYCKKLRDECLEELLRISKNIKW